MKKRRQRLKKASIEEESAPIATPIEAEKVGIEQNPNQKAWVDVTKEPQMNLEFIRPGEAVQFKQEEWEEGHKAWQHAVVGSVVAFKPAFNDVQHWVSVNWKAYNPKVAHIKPSMYMFEFQNEEDKIVVLRRQWSFYHKSPFRLLSWVPDMDVEELDMDTIAEWIQLPNLPYRFWYSKGFSKLVSCIGKPIAIDKLTANITRLGFVRLVVEVNIDMIICLLSYQFWGLMGDYEATSYL